jgi:hypothetical protein
MRVSGFSRIGTGWFFKDLLWFSQDLEKEEVDRYWICWLFRTWIKDFWTVLDIGQIDAISINFWIKSISEMLNCIEH